MKTTVEIPDALLEDARKVAARQQTTLRTLIIEGLRRVVAERKRAGTFRLRKASFRGQGLQPGAQGASWERIRGIVYEEHGG
jgi:CRISPR/Cas system-associated protein Csm6